MSELKNNIKKLLVNKNLLDSKFLKEEGWQKEAQFAWSHFCGITPGFFDYACVNPSEETLPNNIISKLNEDNKKEKSSKKKEVKEEVVKEEVVSETKEEVVSEAEEEVKEEVVSETKEEKSSEENKGFFKKKKK